MAIETRKELLDWLQARPPRWAESIAIRAALRALPIVTLSDEEGGAPLLLAAFRAAAIAWGACSASHLDLNQGARAADKALRAQKDSRRLFGPKAKALLAVQKAIQSIRSPFYADFAAQAAEASTDAFALFAYPTFAAHPWSDDMDRTYAENRAAVARADAWRDIAMDCARLEAVDVYRAAAVLLPQPLRLTVDYDRPVEDDRATPRLLPPPGDHWKVWTQWHQRRVEGHVAGFDIPGDQDRAEDDALLLRLAEGVDEAFWDQDPQIVNRALSRWLEEARARGAPSPPADKPDLEAVARVLEKQASPEARIVDGKLDAGPNQRFDAPRYSGDLAELPSVLLANAAVLRASLPDNADAVIGRCLDAYREELQVRGNRPILSILKAMTSAIRAEVFVPPVGELEERPEKWTLRDSREWGLGTADLFKSFFQYHLDLIRHFPLDPEREALFEATAIDEVAASGPALTEPVDAVAALIRDLADKGFATENIVRIIEAHQIYARDIAQLPLSEDSGDLVSPKRRHVLSSAGFYLSAYTVLGSTASLAPFAPALMEGLRSAAATMLSFIR